MPSNTRRRKSNANFPLLSDSIVADAGPLIAFARIDALELLAKLFDAVRVTQSVFDECTALPALPGAKVIQSSTHIISVYPDPKITALLPDSLSRADRTTIQRALDRHSRVLLDDLRARKSAQHLGLKVVGSIAILLQAKRTGKLPAVKPAMDAMKANHYRIGDDIYQYALQQAAET